LHLTTQIFLGVLIVLWFVPSYNLRLVRHWAEAAVASAMDEDNQPESVQRRRIRQQEDRELLAIADYLRTATAEQTVVVGQDPRLRLWARRSLVVSPADIRYYYYMDAQGLQAWSQRVAEQRRLLEPPAGGPANVGALRQFAQGYGAEFVVIETKAAAAAAGDAPPWVVSPTGQWGRHWKLLAAWDASVTRPAGEPGTMPIID
jgi:hypothetical protein